MRKSWTVVFLEMMMLSKVVVIATLIGHGLGFALRDVRASSLHHQVSYTESQIQPREQVDATIPNGRPGSV